MTEPRHGTGASGWCLGRKRCPECAYAGCGCGCHDGTERPEPQRDSASNVRADGGPKRYTGGTDKATRDGAGNTICRGPRPSVTPEGLAQ